MVVIETRGLSKSYKGNLAVSNFDMRVEKGAIYGFIGRNGAGKSTVMKMICGLAAPTAGEIKLFGGNSEEEASLQRIGVLIESPGLFPHLSAYGNMMGKALSFGLVDPKEKILHLLDLVGLGDTGNKITKQFSMGMKQRLGLALALLGDPDLLLLDEPLNGLDPEGVQETRNLILELNRERGITVLVSSHILAHLGKMVTHYGIIRKGRMVRQMSAAEVQQECSDYLSLQASDPARALITLQEACPDACFTVMQDGSIQIQGAVDTVNIGEVLNSNSIAVHGLYTHHRDLEEYFVGLMGDE